MSQVPPSSTDYRDAVPGAEARRRELLRKRRAELATQPLALRRVYVAASARTVASVALIAGVCAVALSAWVPWLRDQLGSAFPGSRAAVASNLMIITAIATALAYFIARTVAESRYTTSMIGAVRAGDDLFDDLDRLSHTPTQIALGMVERLRIRAAGLWIAAVASATPVAIIAAYAGLERGAWSQPIVLERLFWDGGGGLLVAVCIAGAAGWFVSRLLARAAEPMSLALRLGGLALIASLLLYLRGDLSEPAFWWVLSAGAVGLGIASASAGAFLSRDAAAVAAARAAIATGSR